MIEKIIVLCNCMLIMQWNVVIPAEDYNTYVNCPTVHTAVHYGMIGLLHHNEPNIMCQYTDVIKKFLLLLIVSIKPKDVKLLCKLWYTYSHAYQYDTQYCC